MVHKNILPILAVNSDNPDQPLLVYPYANRGNLKRYICSSRSQTLLLTTPAIKLRFTTRHLQVFAEMSSKRGNIHTVHTEPGRHEHTNTFRSHVSEQSMRFLRRLGHKKLRVSPTDQIIQKTEKKLATALAFNVIHTTSFQGFVGLRPYFSQTCYLK